LSQIPAPLASGIYTNKIAQNSKTKNEETYRPKQVQINSKSKPQKNNTKKKT